MAITHNKVATLPDEDGAEINKAEWNDDHAVSDGSFTIAKTTGLQSAIDGKQATIADGDLTIARTNGLQSALDLKAPLVSPSFTTPALGTPASGTLTNCTGLPLAGLATNAKTEYMSIALGDESTVLAAASDTVPVVTFHLPYSFTLTNVKVGCTIAPTGSSLLTVDVHEAGTTVLSTKITVDASEKTSGTAATQPVISDAALAEDALIEIFVDQIDTDNVAAGLKVYLIGYQT